MANTTLFKYLRQCSRIAENVGQEEYFIFNTKLVFKELFALINLTNKAFAAYKVTIGLNVH